MELSGYQHNVGYDFLSLRLRSTPLAPVKSDSAISSTMRCHDGEERIAYATRVSD